MKKRRHKKGRWSRRRRTTTTESRRARQKVLTLEKNGFNSFSSTDRLNKHRHWPGGMCFCSFTTNPYFCPRSASAVSTPFSFYFPSIYFQKLRTVGKGRKFEVFFCFIKNWILSENWMWNRWKEKKLKREREGIGREGWDKKLEIRGAWQRKEKGYAKRGWKRRG